MKSPEKILESWIAMFLVFILFLLGCQGTTTLVDSSRVVDLSHAFDESTIYWPTASGFKLQIDAAGMTAAGYYYAANSFESAEHGGTHLDAPIHFAKDHWTVDEIPLEHLIGPAVKVDVSGKCAEDRDYQVRVSDFQGWEAENGEIEPGTIVLLYTGFERHWPDRALYLGTEAMGPEAVPHLHFPGLHPNAARWLVEQRAIHAIGLDTASIDYGQSTLFESHRILFDVDVPAFENLMNLAGLPPRGFEVVALPMKIRGGSGGPLRAIALVPASSSDR